MPVSFEQQYTATRSLTLTRVDGGALLFTAQDGGATVALTLTQAQSEPFANFILDVPQPPPPGGDPNWANVVLQSDFEQPDGSTTPFLDDTGRHTIGGMTPNWSQIKTDLPIVGTASHWSFNTFAGQIANSPDFDLSAPFTVDYSFRQTDTESTYNVLSNANGPWAVGFTIRHNGPHMQFAWFDENGVHQSVNASNVGWVANQRHDIRLSWNAAGTVRLFKDGVMVAKAIHNSAVRASNEPLTINQSGAGQQSRLDRLRISNICLHDSDDAYVPGTEPFPIG